MDNYPLGVPGSALDRFIEDGCDAAYLAEQQCERCGQKFPAAYEMHTLYSYVMGREAEVCGPCKREIELDNVPYAALDEQCSSTEEFERLKKQITRT